MVIAAKLEGKCGRAVALYQMHGVAADKSCWFSSCAGDRFGYQAKILKYCRKYLL
jgi:hypothetical protein